MDNAYTFTARDETGLPVSPQTEPGLFDPVPAHRPLPPSQAIHPGSGPQSVDQVHFDHNHCPTPGLSTTPIQPQLGSTALGAPSPYMQQQFVPQPIAPYPFDPAFSLAYYVPFPYLFAYPRPQVRPPQPGHPSQFAHPQFWPQSFGPQPQPSDNRWFNQTPHIPHPTSATPTEQGFPVRAPFGDPDDLYITSMRACHISHRRYLRWISMTYHPFIAPQDFVQEWCDALQEMRRFFGHFHLPDMFVFNQFLAAAAVNPDTRAWVDSLHIPMDILLPPSIMEQVYRDFLVSEARRLNLPLSTWNPQNLATHIPSRELILRHYCPFHRLLGTHYMEDCSLHPRMKFRSKPSDEGSNREKK